MAQIYQQLPLYTTTSYRYSVSLEGTSFNIKIYWNSRAAQWIMDLYEEDQTEIVTGTAIVPQFPILQNFELSAYDLSGYFVLLPVNIAVTDTISDGSDVMPSFFNLYYTYATED